MKGLLTFSTCIPFVEMYHFCNRPIWGGTASMHSQFKVPYNFALIVISILKIASRLNHLHLKVND